jgi:glutamate-ammonia-ligase adenylyltransferase
MDVERLVQLLDHPGQSEDWFHSLGVRNHRAAHAALARIAQSGMTLDLAAQMCGQLQQILPAHGNADMAIANLERFVSASRNPLALGTFWQRDHQALQTLLDIFATSQYFSDLLLDHPESLDLLRMTDGQPTSRQQLVDEFNSEVSALTDDTDALASLSQLIQRERLRIVYGDIVHHQPIEIVTEQISSLAEAICEAVLLVAGRRLESRHGVPRLDGKRARFVILGLGPLGGNELSYSGDIDLMFLCEGIGRTDGDQPQDNIKFFQRLAEKFIQMFKQALPEGCGFHPRLRMRAGSDREVVALDLDDTLRYYDESGRTWERQEMVKARPVAGDQQLGHEFVEATHHWVYRRYLTPTDIGGIKALKRRLVQRLHHGDATRLQVRSGKGGIDDMEQVIQFLQLLNGGDVQQLRTTNTLEALRHLRQAECLTEEESSSLRDSYLSLRHIEHYLQILFDPEMETIPSDDQRLTRLAQKLGYAESESPGELRRRFQQRQQASGRVLERLLEDAFQEQEGSPEADLLYDPWPAREFVESVLSRHRFHNIPVAHANLVGLAREPTRFLSTRRSRFYLAAIAPRLLEAISQTPDADATLTTLSSVSDAIGAKGVLWELFNFNAPSMELYVRLCSASPYLASILTSFPGMIDELLDSLLLEQLPTQRTLQRTLTDLCRGAVSIESIVHGFKSSQHLAVGVRDILGKDNIRATHRVLADITEVCLGQIADDQYRQLLDRYGEPTGPDGERASLVMLALGKLGAREPNYHSDVDVVFLFDKEGTTRHDRRSGETTTNAHFFNELARRVIQTSSQHGPLGRLLELDGNLRATTPHAPLAVSLDDMEQFFASADAPLSQRQIFCKARAIYGTETACLRSEEIARQAVRSAPWSAESAAQIFQQRMDLEQTASVHNIKRGPGGTVDVEVITQMLQLKFASQSPAILVQGTLDALQILRDEGYLEEEDCRVLCQSYDLLRSIESGLRLMNTTARHDLPEEEKGLAQLAFLLGYDDPRQLVEQSRHYREENRRRFRAIFDHHSAARPVG